VRPFLDTNVLVYAATADDPHRQAVALRLVATLGLTNITISTQVLAEAYNVLTRRKRWVVDDALQAVRGFKAMRVVVLGADAVLDALELAARHTLSTWDAMVIHAAQEAGCDTLFSEDLQNGRRFGALQVVNPFLHAAHEASPGGFAAGPPPR
jgi:predicted nucleic acid-binding protein